MVLQQHFSAFIFLTFVPPAFQVIDCHVFTMKQIDKKFKLYHYYCVDL